ncbi:hypothetical protein BDV06DRAFT_20350 [Aspergillus oleicola]
MGDSLYMDWFPYWLSDLALEHDAMIVSANYRLLPQATSLEINEDVADFWTWLRSPKLEDTLLAHERETELDLARLLVTGESAGGLLSINSALGLAYPDSAGVHAAIALYPSVDMKSPDFTLPRSIPPFGQDFDESVIDEILSTAPEGPISSTGGDYLPLMLAAIEYGHLGEWYARGSNETKHSEFLYPLDQLNKYPEAVSIPVGGITIIQGQNDTVVPPGHSVPFVEKMRKVVEEQGGDSEKIQFITKEGEHGFDGDLRYAQEEWLRDALKPVVKAWLK